MSGPRRLLLSAAHLQTISQAARYQLRTRRRPIQFSSASRICQSTRTFTSHVRLRQDEHNKDDGAATLPEETTNIARSQDEPLKPSDLDAIPEDTPATELAEAVEKSEAGEEPKQTLDDGAAILPEETTNIARSQDEPLKPSDLDAIPEDTPASELAEAIEQASAGEPKAQDNKPTGESEGIEEYFEEESEVNERGVGAEPQRGEEADTATILKHGDSEAHQDLREYARLAAWELPLLHKLAKPFTPPPSSSPLRFRYTSYMGDEHPASKKVVVEFKPSALPDLSEAQQIKLIKLAGTRYNPEKQEIKISCESFETPAQNKRYLGDLILKLVQEAKEGKDTFEDIPIDLRHHKMKVVHKFPEEWKTKRPARIEEGKRLRGKGGEKRRVVRELESRGKIVDGVQVVREAMAAMPLTRSVRPVDGQKTVLNARSGGKVKRKAPTTGW